MTMMRRASRNSLADSRLCLDNYGRRSAIIRDAGLPEKFSWVVLMASRILLNHLVILDAERELRAMKKLVHLAFVVFALAMFAPNVSAQKTAEFCADGEAKVALYEKFLANYKLTGEEQKRAGGFANEYIRRYGGCADEDDEKVTRFIRKWLALYAKVVREFDCRTVAYQQQWAKAFEVCQVLVNDNPESTEWPLLLTLAGYANLTSGTNLTAGSHDKSLNPEAAKMARRAVELIEAGKALPNWNPFASRDEAIGFLHYAQGVFLFESAPTDAATAFFKAAQSNSSFKREATTYAYLASLYEINELPQLIAQYRKNFAPPEAIPARSQYDATAAGINKTLDRIIDGYARALSIMNSNPQANEKLKASVMQQLTSYYKERHQDSEAGLTELIAGVLQTPLPVKQ